MLILILHHDVWGNDKNNGVDLFPLGKYDQRVSHWIPQTAPDYNTLLISRKTQQKRFRMFLSHYFGDHYSPWSKIYMTHCILKAKERIIRSEEKMLHILDNGAGKKQVGGAHYGENFRPYSQKWVMQVKANMNLAQLSIAKYQTSHRAIAIDNLHIRALPTQEVVFYGHQQAGGGYPFDDLQISALWAGTPVYIFAQTRDLAWSLVITPDCMGWVKSNGIAQVSTRFIRVWVKQAKNHLAAIVKENTSIRDRHGKFLFSAYIGSIFPMVGVTAPNRTIKLLVPDRNQVHLAIIKSVTLSSKNVVLIPLSATPHHFADLIRALIGRPYGWGGMYFYNDCSAELKSLFTPFGIWLPRQSAHQKKVAGRIVDLSIERDASKRLAYLREYGHKFFTIVYIGGHVILYIGHYSNSFSSLPIVMTYQNIWGLKEPASLVVPEKRVILGAALLFPMLLSYPEYPQALSLANKSYFQIAYLDQLPTANQLKTEQKEHVKDLMDL